MMPFAVLISPLALLLPVLGGGQGREPVSTQDGKAGLTAEQAIDSSAESAWARWLQTAMPMGDLKANQVRIEQRVILRISPRPSAARENLVATLAPRQQSRTRLVERAYADCLPVGNIAAVQAQRGSRLLLFLRDRRLLAADLEKACLAQNFYSGFYLEPNDDGRLCVDRDRLQARNGTKCSVSSLRQIVAVAED